PSASLLQQPALIVLSAKNEERLSEKVRQLLTWIESEDHVMMGGGVGVVMGEGLVSPPSLHDLAYTLQVGREAMEERLALQVSSLVELEEQLGKYLQESQGQGNWHRGQVKEVDANNTFTADEDGQRAIAAWMSKGKYGKLLEFWVKG